MTETQVSCVIPTHQRDELCLRAVSSVLKQEIVPVEIIVVDDSGRDPERPSLQAIADLDPRVHVLPFENPSKSAAASRNFGASRASSSVLAFLDDDDYWLPSYLATALIELERSEADFVVTWGAMLTSKGLVHKNWAMETGCRGDDVIAGNPGITGSNFVIRRAVFDRVGGFDSEMVVNNDLDFLIRLLDAGATYSVVSQELVVQDATGAAGSHLSSRGPRQVEGLNRYRAKYASRLTRRQDRILQRQSHIARLVPGTPRPEYARHLVGALVFSYPTDFVQAFKRRMSSARYE